MTKPYPLLGFILFLFFAIQLPFVSKLMAQSVANISTNDKEIPFFDTAYFWQENGNQSFDNIRLGQANFKPLQKLFYYREIKDQTLWLRYHIRNRDSIPIDLVLSIENSYMAESQIFLTSKLGLQIFDSHDCLAVNDAQLYYNLPHWKFTLHAQTEYTLYVRMYDNIRRSRILTRLQQAGTFEKTKMKYLLLNGMYLTINLLICLLRIILAFGSKQIYSFSYCFQRKRQIWWSKDYYLRQSSREFRVPANDI